MEIYAVGYNFRHITGVNIDRPTGFGNYYTMILTQTKGTFLLNSEEIVAPPFSFIIYSSGAPQHFQSSTPYVHSWIHFDLDKNDTDILPKELELDKFYFLDKAVHILHLFELLNQEFFSENIYKFDSSRLLFDLIVRKVSEQIISPKTSDAVFYKDTFKNIRSTIYAFPTHKWTVKLLAEQAEVSESYFQHLYKKYFGVSVISDVIASRIKYAKLLLITTSSPLPVIAEETGYNSTSLFTRQFKSVTSMSPGAYRKKNMLYEHVYDQQEHQQNTSRK